MEKYKIIIALFSFLGIMSSIMSCETPGPCVLTETDKKYIQDVTDKVQDDWNRGEKEAYVNRFSEDAIYMAPNMVTLKGKGAIRTFANSFPELKVKFSILEIGGSAEHAFVHGKFVLTTPTDSLFDEGKFVSIWKKTPDSNWLLTHDIFSSDLPLSVRNDEPESKK